MSVPRRTPQQAGIRAMTRKPRPSAFRTARSLCAVSCLTAIHASAAENFTLVATEANTKDMSVSLGVDLLRSEEQIPIGDKRFGSPITVAGRDAMAGLLNHDSGVLDVQHTDYRPANLSSRILLQFLSLQEELQAHCWGTEDASQLKATLRLRVIPPDGPQKHNRLFGISPSTWMAPAVGLDPPPASVSLSVYRQPSAWVEGPGQNSFLDFLLPMSRAFSSTPRLADDADSTDFQEELEPYGRLFQDAATVGVRAEGTTWDGVALGDGVDTCLNRQEGRTVQGTGENSATLCYDESPNWEPWVEWDVTKAVRFWIDSSFSAESDHGFTIYQSTRQPFAELGLEGIPAWFRSDQVRITPEVSGQARSRTVVSFAASSGAADCRGAGGQYGGASQVDQTYGNMICMTTGDELESNPIGDIPPGVVPQFVEPLVHPDWAPQLVIEGLETGGQCPASLAAPTRELDVEQGESLATEVVFHNRSSTPLMLLAPELTGDDAFQISDDACAGATIDPDEECRTTLALRSESLGSYSARLVVGYRRGDDEFSAPTNLVGTVSEDSDGIPDATEADATNDGDANRDGTPDRQQASVASFRNSAGQALSLVVDDDQNLRHIEQRELPLNRELGAIQFDDGFYSFEIHGVNGTGPVEVQLLGFNSEATAYYVYGEGKNGDPEPGWELFEYDGTSGALFDAEGLTLSLRDGEWGDADGEVNGVIRVLAGGPGTIDRKNFRLTDASVGSMGPVGLGLGALTLLVLGLTRRRRSYHA